MRLSCNVIRRPAYCRGIIESDQLMSDIRYLCVGILAAGLAIAFAPAAAAAPKLSDPDDAAVKAAIASCKVEAKEKKIRFPASRAFLRDCVTETIRKNPR